MKYEMDNLDACNGIGGVGYLREKNKKLPARDKVNYNSCFLIKRVIVGSPCINGATSSSPRNISLEDMPWPKSVQDANTPEGPSFDGKAFRNTVIETAEAFEQLALALLPIYATALKLDPKYFESSFASPLFRMRLARYEPTPANEFGINPHVDTSFFTLLATTDHSSLVVFSHAKQSWVRAKHLPGMLIVNTGETLSRITNDTWPATRHYVLNSSASRYSLPFFFNPTATARMAVLETCLAEGEKPKYEPVSYLEGQGVVQGE